MGVDCEYNSIYNAFIQNTFGSYTFSSLGNFLTNAHPSVYQLGFPLIDNNNNDHTASSAKFSLLKTSFFVNDEIKPSNHFSLNYGIRLDYHRFLTQPWSDDYVNHVAIPAFASYWDLQGAVSGAKPMIPLSVSPRMGFTYRIKGNGIVLRGGIGIFSGRIPLAWPAGLYTNNGAFIGGYMANAAQLNTIRFKPDPYHQWTAAETGAIINKEPLNLVSQKLSMPKLFRFTLTLEKKNISGWSFIAEAMLSKNINEIFYTNVNLLPPVDHATGPDNRNIYTGNNNGRIPLNADGSNPFDYAILISNNKGETGYAKSFTTTVSKKTSTGLSAEINYTLQKSIAVNDGTASVNLSQWRSMETVNGRNALTRSVSDFSLGHRIFAWAGKKILYRGKKAALSISLVYTGESGSPMSYVYGNYSMVRDDGITGANDLIYIPTKMDLTQLVFLYNTINGTSFSPQQQKDAFEKYIENDPYLKNRRGNYAERNGSRTPFTHIFDLKIKQDFNIRIRNNHYQFQLSLDVYNIGNLLNPQWGKRYFLQNDHFALVDFAGYQSPGNLTPQYRFNPIFLNHPPWKISQTFTPGYAAFWSSQLGFRYTFN